MLKFFSGVVLGATGVLAGTFGYHAQKTSCKFTLDFFSMKGLRPASISLEGLNDNERAAAIKIVTSDSFLAKHEGDKILLTFPYPKGGLDTSP